MLGVYGFLIAGLAAALSLRPIRPRSAESPSETLDSRLLCAIAVPLVALTWWHERLIGRAADVQLPMPDWLAALPVVPVMDVRGFSGAGAGVSSLVEIVSVLEAGLLAVLAVASAGRRLSRGGTLVAALAAAALAAIALRAPAMLSADAYAYVAYGLLGADAYAPTAGVPGGPFAPILRLWGGSVPPCAYGPAWLFPATVLVHGAHDLADGILRFRLAGAACVVLIAVLLMRLGLPLAVVSTFALNPAVWIMYVADAHNDAWPVALVLAARAAARCPPAAALLAGAAGAAKVPFVAIGALSAAGAGPRARLRAAAGCVAVALAASVTFGGPAYVRALLAVERLYRPPVSLGAHVVQSLGLLGALLAAAGALGWSRTAWPASFSFGAIGFAPFAWYALWGLPYAVLADGTAGFLCLLPIVSFVTATAYAVTPLWPPLIAVVFIAAAAYAYRNVRALRTGGARP